MNVFYILSGLGLLQMMWFRKVQYYCHKYFGRQCQQCHEQYHIQTEFQYFDQSCQMPIMLLGRLDT